MAIANLNVSAPSIPQPDFSWLDSLAGSIRGAIDRTSQNRSFNRLDQQFDQLTGGQRQGAPVGGFLSGLMGRDQTAATSPAPPVGRVERADIGTPNTVYNDFISAARNGGLTNPFGLSALAATGRAESGWSPQNVNRSWSDPSQSGQAGTAGGILSWRNERLQNLRNFAQQKGEDPRNISPATQAEFFLSEDPNLVQALNNARSTDEAAGIMANAWKFAGYDSAGGEAARRRAMATNYYAQQFRDSADTAGGAPASAQSSAPTQSQPRVSPDQVASLDPSAGIPMPGWAGPMRANDPGRVITPQSAPIAANTPQQAPSVPTSESTPISASQINTGYPLPRQAQAQSVDLPAATPMQRGQVPSDLIRFMLRDPNLRDMGPCSLAAERRAGSGRALAVHQAR